jgi:hypothetical protein
MNEIIKALYIDFLDLEKNLNNYGIHERFRVDGQSAKRLKSITALTPQSLPGILEKIETACRHRNDTQQYCELSDTQHASSSQFFTFQHVR